MAGRKRSISLFLMDGDVKGTIKITTKPWNGLLLRIPRDRLYDCGERDEMKYSSIYFLVGPSNKGDIPTVYVGQVGMRGILKRLTEHDKNPEKSFWTEAIVLTTNDNGLGATELNYLEHIFYVLAMKSKRCVVHNALEPNPGNVNEETVSELEETVELTQNILELLGYKFFTQSTHENTEVEEIATEEAVERPESSEITVDYNKKIGRFVAEEVAELLKSGRVPAKEIKNLTSLEYCKKTFKKKVYYPVLIEWPENVEKSSLTLINGYSRYYSDIVIPVHNKRYLLSSQWYRESYDALIAWYKKYV